MKRQLCRFSLRLLARQTIFASMFAFLDQKLLLSFYSSFSRTHFPVNHVCLGKQRESAIHPFFRDRYSYQNSVQQAQSKQGTPREAALTLEPGDDVSELLSKPDQMDLPVPTHGLGGSRNVLQWEQQQEEIGRDCLHSKNIYHKKFK